MPIYIDTVIMRLEDTGKPVKLGEAGGKTLEKTTYLISIKGFLETEKYISKGSLAEAQDGSQLCSFSKSDTAECDPGCLLCVDVSAPTELCRD